MVCLWVVGSSAAFSDVQVEMISSAKNVAPGEFATHVFSVTNDSSITDSIDLVFTIPDGWGILGAPTTLLLNPSEQQTLFVTVTIPSGAVAGGYEVSLKATSQGAPAQSATASGWINVRPVNELEVILPAFQSVQPGAKVIYELVVINRGNAQDTVSIEASSAEGFPVIVSHPTLSLSPQERVAVTLSVEIPAGAGSGRDLLSFSVSSKLYPGVSKYETLFTTILPAGPQAVGGTLMQELPSRLRFSFGQNVFTGDLDSNLALSVSGGVLDGYFSSYLGVSSVFGPDPLDVGYFYLSYRLSPSTYRIGDVYQKITNLLAINGRGGSLLIDDDYYKLTFIGGGSSDETRAAIGLAAGPRDCRLGIAHLEKRGEASHQMVWSLTGHARPLEDWTIDIEGALGKDGVLSSRAFFFNTTIDSGSYYFDGQVFSIGSYFPGLRSDSAGIQVSQRVRLSSFSLAASMSHDWDNVSSNPSFTRTIKDQLGVNISATPHDDGPTINSTVEFTWRRDPQVTSENEVRRLFFVELRNLEGVLPYSFSGKVSDQLDNIAETSYRTLTFSEGIGLSIQDIDLFMTLTHTKNLELMTYGLISGGTIVDISFRANGSMHSGSISLTNDNDEFDLRASVSAEIIDNLDLDLSANIGWDRAELTAATFSWSTAFNWRFDLPVPFLVTKARVGGRVFIDTNSNGQLDEEDMPLEGVILSIGRSDVSTDADGRFRFPPLNPGTYTVDLSRIPLNARLISRPIVSLCAGLTKDVEIPLAPVSLVEGILFNDSNKDGARSEEESGFAQVRIIITDEQGNETDSYTGAQGRFSFSDVLPGRYVVSVDAWTLPDRFVFTTDPAATIDVTSRKQTSIELGGFIKPRQVVITFQPPTADFYFTPDNPVVGEIVTFDGSDSFDFDGEVVAYAWDLNGDGETDADTVIVETRFPASGSYDVTLTITDNDGNSDSITYTIEVK